MDDGVLLVKPRLPLCSTEVFDDKLLELSTVDTLVEFEVSFEEVFVESFDVGVPLFDVVVDVVDEISPDIVELSLVDVVTLRSAISCRFIRSNFSI